MSFDGVLRSQQTINTLARNLIERPAFEEVNVIIPDSTSPESAFIRATSWLYCLYFEAGPVSLRFLRRLGEAYSLVEREESDLHVESVRSLRTELHHNLGFADSDRDTRTAAEIWRRNACGTMMPTSGAQWRACYSRIVDDAQVFLTGIEAVVRQLESDGDEALAHIEEWRSRLDRNWPGYKFDPLIDDAKYRFSRESLNTVSFRNRHVDKWRNRLELLEDGFHFEFEATRLIEKTLLDDDDVLPPITGKDIVEVLGIKPGPRVGALLHEARRHFEVNQTSREDLLAHLRSYEDRAVQPAP